MTLVIGQSGPLASQVTSVYTVPLQLSKVFSPRHFKGIDHIHMYATHNRVHMFNYLANMTWLPRPARPSGLPSSQLCTSSTFTIGRRTSCATMQRFRAAKTAAEIGGHRFQSTDKYFGNCQNRMSLVCCMPNMSVNLRCRVGKNPTWQNIFLKQFSIYNFD